MHILLMGNPNVGKSAFFSRITGTRVIASNYPGTTVEFTEGFVRIDDSIVDVIDVPGTYTLEPTSKAEEVASEMLRSAAEGDIVINVVDATNLERNLYLTMELMEQNVPIIVALNMWDETKHHGINIDAALLEQLLGIPVVPTVSVTGEGVKELVERIPQAISPKIPERTRDERWAAIGEIIERAQSVSHHHHTWRERLHDVSVKPVTGLPLAAISPH